MLLYNSIFTFIFKFKSRFYLNLREVLIVII